MSKIRGNRLAARQKTPTKETTAGAWLPWLPDGILPDLLIGLGLILSIFVVYGQVAGFEFINYDDPYVFDSVQVKAGLAFDSIKWAFTALVSGNWIPVTLLSHVLDGQLFDMRSGMHHLMNVVYHAMTAILVFVVFRRATGARYPSAFVAFIFALHPLHVGSVAWITERKDVLSGFFFFLALFCYVRYTERPGAGRYLLVAGSFCLGLLSKPMLVTFPFTLLLFDLWPLRRFQWPGVLWEKLPLFALSAGSSLVTYSVQSSTGSVDRTIALATRSENALISYLVYLGQTFWPVRLAVFYPYPKSIAAWQAIAAAVVLLGASALAMLQWRKRPYLTMGWFWYVGTLVPVIGLVQVGLQAHADRYMYLPMIGLSVILAWGVADAIRKRPEMKTALTAAAIASCAVCLLLARTETAYWRNSETLFGRAIEVTEDNGMAETNLGHLLMMMPGRASEAIPHLEAAFRIAPDLALNSDLGACMLISKRYPEAVPYFEAILRVNPQLADAHYNLGMALAHTPGRETDAVSQYEEALRLRPDNDLAHNNLGLLLLKQGRTLEALPHFQAAVRLHPDYGSERNLGDTLMMIGKQSEAIPHLEAAFRLNPDPELASIIDRLRAGLK